MNDTNKTTLIKCHGTMGAVLDATPIVRRLKAEDPETSIHISTNRRDVFRRNPYINNAHLPHSKAGKVFNLSSNEECFRTKPAVDCFSQEVFGDEHTEKSIYLQFDERPPDIGVDLSTTICVHPARTWPHRTIPLGWWYNAVGRLTDRGWTVAVTGTGSDYRLRPDFYEPRNKNVVVLTGKLRLDEQASLINSCAAFLGSDSGLVNLAHATKVPIVSLLTISNIEMQRRHRFGQLGWGYYPISANVDCTGCWHKFPEIPFECLHQGSEDYLKCVKAFDIDEVVERVTSAALLHKDKNFNAQAKVA